MEAEIGDIQRAIIGFERASKFYFEVRKFTSLAYTIRAAELEMRSGRPDRAKQRLLRAREIFSSAQAYQDPLREALQRTRESDSSAKAKSTEPNAK